MAAGVPTSVVVEINYSGSTWTAVSSSVKSWSVKQGSDDGSVSGGELTLVLDNFDGTFTPDNPTSSAYPNFVEGKAIRVTVTKTPSSSVRFFGYITAIVPDYPSEPTQSTTTVTALDIIGIASRTKAKPMPWASAIRLASSSAAYYPLTDKSTRLGFSDVFDRMPDLTARTVSSGGEIDAAGDDSFTPDTDPCVKITAGRSIRHTTGALNFVGNGLIAFLYKPQPSASNNNIFLSIYGSDSTPMFYVSYDGVNDNLNAGPDPTGWSGSTDPGTVQAEEWHAVVVTFDGSFLYVDVDVDNLVMADAVPSAPTRLEFGGSSSFSIRDLFIDPTIEFSEGPTVAALYAKTTGLASSTLTEQTTYWGDILDVNPSWSSTVAGIPAGGLLVGGRSALESLQALARSQSGVAYCTYTSTAATINLLANAQARPTTVALTVDVELDADGGPSLARGLAEQVAEVRAFSSTGETTFRDPSASTNIDASTVDLETALASAALRRAVAQDVAAQSQNAKQRITNITVDLVTASNNLYSSFFNLTIGERVRVSNLPSTYFGLTHMDGYVTGWTEGGTADVEYRVDLSLSPADAPPEGLWDDSTYGRWGFGDGVCTNSSSATIGATSVQFQWTGGLTLSTSAGDYPLDLDWNGERITVNSAPAGGSSPQTLSITRGVAPTVARAHNAGETVEIWNAARWAM